MKTNFEALKVLKDYEAAQILHLLFLHVTSIMEAQRADGLDAIDQLENEFEIITSWLNHPYEENKGFKFYIFQMPAITRSDYLKQFEYLAGSNSDYGQYFNDAEESDNEEDYVVKRLLNQTMLLLFRK